MLELHVGQGNGLLKDRVLPLALDHIVLQEEELAPEHVDIRLAIRGARNGGAGALGAAIRNRHQGVRHARAPVGASPG
eukprot:3844583-Alexandrium_andersonii.AAC.1